MFGFGKKKKKTVADLAITAIYGDPPPPKRADVREAIRLASEELLMNKVVVSQVQQVAEELASGPVPYSTHDLALSVALNFFKRPDYIPVLRDAQLVARMQSLQWFQEGLVARLLVESMEKVLYELYKS